MCFVVCALRVVLCVVVMFGSVCVWCEVGIAGVVLCRVGLRVQHDFRKCMPCSCVGDSGKSPVGLERLGDTCGLGTHFAVILFFF